jgi:hypothetical protein
MGRGVSSWLAGGRSLQLLGSLAASAVHGYLMVEVHRARVEISKGMVMLQLMVCSPKNEESRFSSSHQTLTLC